MRNNNEENKAIPEDVVSTCKTNEVDVQSNEEGSSELELEWNVTDNSRQVCRGKKKLRLQYPKGRSNLQYST